VPADDKDSARLIVSRVILDVFEELKMSYPAVTPARKRELRDIRKTLEKRPDALAATPCCVLHRTDSFCAAA